MKYLNKHFKVINNTYVQLLLQNESSLQDKMKIVYKITDSETTEDESWSAEIWSIAFPKMVWPVHMRHVAHLTWALMGAGREQ